MSINPNALRVITQEELKYIFANLPNNGRGYYSDEHYRIVRLNRQLEDPRHNITDDKLQKVMLYERRLWLRNFS